VARVGGKRVLDQKERGENAYWQSACHPWKEIHIWTHTHTHNTHYTHTHLSSFFVLMFQLKDKNDHNLQPKNYINGLCMSSLERVFGDTHTRLSSFFILMFHLKGKNDHELQHKNYIDLSLNQGHHITNISGT